MFQELTVEWNISIHFYGIRHNMLIDWSILTVWYFYEPTFRLDLIFKYRMNLFDSFLNIASAIKRWIPFLGEFQAFSIQNNLIGFTSFSWLFVGIKRKSFFNWHNV